METSGARKIALKVDVSKKQNLIYFSCSELARRGVFFGLLEDDLQGVGPVFLLATNKKYCRLLSSHNKSKSSFVSQLTVLF